METTRTASLWSVSKTYSNLKAAHRQWRHPGHCQYIHGENWTFQITFACSELDPATHFVVDFGRLRTLKDFLDLQFDHTLLLDEDDPELSRLCNVLTGTAVIRIMPYGGSAEGLARYVAEHANRIVMADTSGRVFVTQVLCLEDDKNSATYYLPRQLQLPL